MPRSWVLGIDFGTSYTVVAGRLEGHGPELVEVDGERRLPSIVFVDEHDQIVVGQFAERMLASRPGSVLRSPKARLGDPAPVVLAGRARQVTELVSPVLRVCASAAERHFGSPPSSVRLTHPATWSRSRLARLDEAARLAGLSDVVFVSEPVAAALAYWQRGDLPTGALVAIYDLGGGTFDTAILRATADAFEIVGRPSGDASIGGEMFDELVVQAIGQQLGAGEWEQIQMNADPVWSHARAVLRMEARQIKETLSTRPWAEASIALPGGVRIVRLDRAQLDVMLEPFVDDSVDTLTRCVADAGLVPRDLVAIQLVGGASHSPIIERMVANAFPGTPIHRRGDPKAAVALGAVLVPDAAAVALDLAGRPTPTPNPRPISSPTPVMAPIPTSPVAPLPPPGPEPAPRPVEPAPAPPPEWTRPVKARGAGWA